MAQYCHRILQNENQAEGSNYRILNDLQYAMFFHKSSSTKFEWCILRNLLINENFEYFKNVI